MKVTLRGTFLALAFLVANQAFANPCPPGNPPTNCAPPGGAILDLDLGAVPHEYTQYFTSFVAVNTTTNISFAFREDPAFVELDDVSVTQGGGSNLLLNPGFELGPLSANAPTDWTYLNSFGATFGGVVGGAPHSGTNAYIDGAVQAYDGITQSIATTVGLTYDVSFWLTDTGSLATFHRLSTNGNDSGTGGNGVDVLAYAGAVPTLNSVPEPATLTLLGIGLVGARFSRRRKVELVP